MNKVLCTGASGFLGRHCLPLLIQAGYEVHAVQSPTRALGHLGTARDDPTRSGIHWHVVNLLEVNAVEHLLSQTRPTHLLHLAWAPAIPGQFWHTDENLSWVHTSLSLLQSFAAHGGKRIVTAGTCAEYDWSAGSHEGDPFHEQLTPLRPSTVYGTCKHALQLMTSVWTQQNDISSAWGRVFFTYGPHEYSERLVASVIRALLRGEPALCSHGEQIRDFLYILDLAAAFVALLESPVQGPVNMASGCAVTVKEIVCEVGAILQRPDLIRLGARPAPLDEPTFVVADTSRLNREVGWMPSSDLHCGLRQTVEWWKAQRIE
jgi:nucleoside-diphosphate-sugar epimerase